MKVFDYYEPQTLAEACDILSTAENSAAIAGGTDLVVQMKHGKKSPSVVVNLKNIDELQGVSFCGDGVRIGALTKISAIAESKEIYDGWRSVAVGADNIGTPQVRNLATIGGNICNSSPCADTVPSLIVSRAEAIIAGKTGERRVPLDEFFKGPGKNCLEKGELLKAVWLPQLPAGTVQAFYKMGPRKAADIAVVNIAISLSMDNDVCTDARIAAGSVAPTPIRIAAAEEMLKRGGKSCNIEEVAELVSEGASPIDDVRGSASYRRHILKVMTVRLLDELWG